MVALLVVVLVAEPDKTSQGKLGLVSVAILR